MDNKTNLTRVMLVEDEADIRIIAKYALEKIGGLTVHYCQSGEEALESVEDFSPDIILLDMMMPGIDGIATFKAIQAKPSIRKIPIIFMTAKAQPTEVNLYRELGAVDVIVKPFDPITLADKLSEIWERI